MLEPMPFALHATSADPTHAELAALSALVRRGPWPSSDGMPGPAGLLLPSVLAGDPAHPLLLCVLMAEVAARRGIPLGVVSNGRDHVNAHTQLGEPLVLRPECGTIVDARELPPPLNWRCSHETCALLIDALEPLWLRDGRLDRALTTAELRLCLPFEERALELARRRLEHVRARLN